MSRMGISACCLPPTVGPDGLRFGRSWRACCACQTRTDKETWYWGRLGLACCSTACLEALKAIITDEPEHYPTFDDQQRDFTEEERDSLVRSDAEAVCAIGMAGCGRPTLWRDLSYGTDLPCCSRGCRQIMNEYTNVFLHVNVAAAATPEEAPAEEKVPEAEPAPDPAAPPPAEDPSVESENLILRGSPDPE